MKLDYVISELGKKPYEKIQKNLPNGDILTILNVVDERVVIVCLNGEVLYHSAHLLVRKAKPSFLKSKISDIKIKGKLIKNEYST